MQSLRSPSDAAMWLRQHVTGVLCTDSRAVKEGDAFIAWPGAATDGRAYVASALAQGASVCLVEENGSEAMMQNWHSAAIPVAHSVASYSGLKADLGFIADAYYEQPSRALKVLAVTGTNGKTSTTWWLAQALNSLDVMGAATPPRCGLIGTLGVGVPPHLKATGMTTPDPVLLQAQFRNFVDAGVQYCAVEASSIGIAEQRLAGVHIQLAVMTNVTQDHLDYHGTMADYWQAKRALFHWPELEVAVINVDDAQGALLAEELKAVQPDAANAKTLDVWTCSSRGKTARLQVRGLKRSLQGMSFEVMEGNQVLPMQTSLMGDYNVDNLLSVMASLRALDWPLAQVVAVCADLKAVPGRMEKVEALQDGASPHAALPLTLVDYAHTPDAVTQSLAALKPFAEALGSQLWCVLGCGGNRDASKRPLMAAAAEAVANKVVLTSDNPRNEMPEAILADMLSGLKAPEAVHQELDRAKAIQYAVAHAGASDVILIAGKGHEQTQDIGGVKHLFDDRAQARAALMLRASGELQQRAAA
jgi:UDP-N-acetylmuramoyl-L-alanyl-D-glutamate--2,6-diaminopimelate ligase